MFRITERSKRSKISGGKTLSQSAMDLGTINGAPLPMIRTTL
jgi:hypothetical protein